MTAQPDEELLLEDDHDGGLGRDLAVLLPRRRVLQLFGGAALMALDGCAASKSEGAGATTTASPTTTAIGSASTSAATSTTAGASTTGASGTVTETIPEETAGPYPADGSNGVERADVERRRPAGHPFELRVGVRRRRGDPDDR
jgi:hypothetical protein